jgi:hypothetical protein
VRLTPPGERATAVIEALANPTPLVRSIPSPDPSWTGVVYAATYGAPNPTGMVLWVSERGHSYMNGDARCRSCDAAAWREHTHGTRCPKPPSAQDIVSALLVGFPRPAPSVPRALYMGVSA